MGTKLTELRNGCFHRAMDDEPMFVLLARDPSAPSLVLAWAQGRELEIRDGKRPASDMEMVEEAREAARKMMAWREANDGAWREGLFPEHPTEQSKNDLLREHKDNEDLERMRRGMLGRDA
jgi:hypothetical protein